MSFIPFETHSQTFALTAVTSPSPAFTQDYTGTFPNGGSNGLAGTTFTIAGFTNSGNNGVFICLASTTTTITTYPNFAGGAETHAATATSSPFFGIGPAQPNGSDGFPAVPINIPNRLMISSGQPLIFSPSGFHGKAGIAYTSEYHDTNSGDETPSFMSKTMNPQVSPTFPFTEIYEGWLTSDESFTGDASGCFLDVLDINTSLRSPAHWGQIYGMLLEHGAVVANGEAIHVDDFRRIYAESLNGNGAGTNAVYNFGKFVGFNCATGGYFGPQNGIIGTSWGMNFEGPRLGGGNSVYTSHMGIRMASQQQGAVQGTFTLTAATSATANTVLTLTSVATASDGLTVYTGTITGGGGSAFAGYYFTIAGFTTSANNGTFFCVASSATTLTLVYSGGVSETSAATATLSTSDYTGTFQNGGSNAFAGQVFVIAGFVNTGSALTLTAAGDATSAGSLPGMTTYTGTITGGDSNGHLGRTFAVAGFATGANNGTFKCYASTATTLTLANPNGTSETHAATATPQTNNGIFRCKASTTTTITLNNYLATAETHAGTAISRNGAAWGIHQDDGAEKNALGSINLGGESGPLVSAGSASPESSITSSVGGLYLRTGGSSGTALYSKETGSSNTGWIPLRNATQNAQTGTSYTVLDGDRAKLVTLSNTAAVAVTLPQANSSTFISGWYAYFENINTGTVTITPTTSTINGFTSITLFQWQWAIIFSDGTNYEAMIQPLSSNDAPASLLGYLTNDAGTGAARNQLIVRNINTGVNANRKGLNVYHEHDGAASASNYDGLQVNTGFTFDGLTSKTQGQTDGVEVVAYGAVAQATFTSVANASAGTTVYTGTIQNGANNGLAGLTYTIAGFTNGANNGVFSVTASTATTLTVNNAAGVAETHAGTATPLTTFTLTSVANASGGSTVYTGTIPNGGSNFYSGWQFRITGFTTAANNGLFPCTASTTTTLTLTNAAGVAETHAASAIWYTHTEINTLKLRWGMQQSGNCLNHTALLQYLPSIQANSNIENFTGFVIDAPAGTGVIWNATGMVAGTSYNNLTSVGTEIGLIATGSSNNSTVGYAITATGKTAGIVCSDATAAASFIGHGTLSNGVPTALHDGWYAGNGSPEGVVTAAVGSMWSRQNSTIGDAFYIKGTGSGNTGWAPSSTLSPIVTKTTTYTATNSDGTLLGNGTFTITLPTTNLPTGKTLRIKNIGTGVITVSSSVNIDGATSFTLPTQYQSADVQWDGTQWWIL